MVKFLVVLGSGGHTKQMVRLVDLLGDEFEYDYVIGKSDNLSENKIRKDGDVYWMKETRGKEESLFSAIFRQIPGCFRAYEIIKESEPDVILACGPNFSVPICFMGKLIGKKVIFLESWSRVYSKSLSGRFVYNFADLFFVQWPEMKEKYEDGIYAGRLI